MNKFKIPIGDWSKDGHSQCDEYIIECNYSVKAVRQAYKDSCKLTGLQFNHNEDYTGLNLKRNHPEYNDRHIAVKYESNTISKLAEDILKQYGIDIWEGFDEEEYNKETEKAPIDGSEHFLELLMDFIKLTLTDLQYKIVKNNIPYLNGYWNQDLNVQFGYGLFD